MPNKVLVQFVRDEIQPFHRVIAFARVGQSNQVLFRHLIGDKLQDYRAFGQQVAVVQPQRRDVGF